MSQSIKVRLLQRLRVDGFIWSRGLVIPLPSARAKQLIRIGVAEYADPESPPDLDSGKKETGISMVGVRT